MTEPVSRTMLIFVCAALLGVLTAEAEHTKAYVTNQGSNTVTVIDDQRVSAIAARPAWGLARATRTSKIRISPLWRPFRSA